MKQIISYIPLAAASLVCAAFLSFFSAGAGAVDIVVPTDAATIQAALAKAAAGDTVIVEPGSYQETITLKDSVTVRGRETARTLLSGGGGGPVVVVNGPIAADIHNFTFINASTGIQVTGNTSKLSITNNVFEVGSGNIGVAIQNSAQTEVVNNVFYQNGTAVSRDADITIINNIFANNSTAIASTVAASAKTSYNDFFSNSTSGPTGTNSVTGDPLFADPANHDFHLQEGTLDAAGNLINPNPCIDAGNPSIANDIIDDTQSDIGAYGGPEADPIPFPVGGLSVTGTTDTSISLTWLPNKSYLVTNSFSPGEYLIHYGYASGVYNGTDSGGGEFPSPVEVPPPDTSFTLLDLNPSFLAPAAPVLAPLVPGDGKLELTWSAVPGATGYKVHYGPRTTGENAINVGNVTSYPLSGLTNGQPYRVAVTAFAESRYFIVITALDSTFDPTHESAFSPEKSATIGPVQESALSNEQADFPDPVQAYPALPNGRHSCFIATAAYGSYSAPEVLALRAFRDRYLLSNAPGRRFVEWYYRRGPAAAALLNAHTAWKPAVRAALLPFVGAAIFMTGTSTVTKAAAAFSIALAVVFCFRKKRLSGMGEHR